MAGDLLNRARLIVVLLGVLILPVHPALAETVEAKLPSGIIATADFRAGQPALPAVLLIHGFLQARSAPPMNNLSDTLADQGYTVLSPTLSLGMDRRNQSLACEAVHTHTMEKDVAEIGFWVNWLTGKGYTGIVLISHSASGGIQTLLYVAQKPNPAVKKVILTSLIPFYSESKERQATLRQMMTKQPAGEKTLGRFTLGYCNKNYAAPARAYLSYAMYDSGKTLRLFAKAKVPVENIMGSVDTTMDKGWPEKIRSLGVAVSIIEKSGHFFDGAQEFDLADKVETILKTLPEGSR